MQMFKNNRSLMMMGKIFILIILFVPGWLYAAETCLSSIKKKSQALFVENCFTSERTMQDAILFDYPFEHKFGSEKNPSTEALYLKLESLKGEPASQFLWSLVQGIVYKNKEEQQKWLYKSADAHFERAMIAVINKYSSFSYSREHELNERVVRYLKILIEADYPEAKRNLEAIESEISDSELADIFQMKLNQYKALPSEDVMNLAGALDFGVYGEGIVLNNGIKVSKDINKSMELYTYLMDERNIPESGYRLGRFWEDRNFKLAIKYYTWSANNNYADSAAWLGKYYGCIEDKEKSKEWLDKASELGHKFSALILSEIKEFGMPANCRDSWVNN